RDRTDVDVDAWTRLEWIVQRRRPDARDLRLRPAAAEEVRAAGAAERLRAANGGLERLQQFLALENPDRLRRHAPIHGSDAARELLAAFAVAPPERRRRLCHLERAAPAEPPPP